MLFRKGQLGASGAVTWDSTRLGSLEAMGPAGVDPETAAIEAGAQVESFLAALDEDEDDVQSVFMGL